MANPISNSKTVLLTGANGFIGEKLRHRLAKQAGVQLIAVVRNPDVLPIDESYRILGAADYLETDWDSELENVDTVVHVAGIISPPESAEDPGAVMLKVNGTVTARLAQAAVARGVRQFIYLSSLSVFGEENDDRLLSPESATSPTSSYARSKLAGEKAVENAATGTSMNFVIIRPPMVVGTGAKGTFYAMANLCAKTGFSPFGSIAKPYPIVFTETLVDFIAAAVVLHPVENGVYLVGEEKLYSVPNIINQIAALSGRSVCHIPFPQTLLKWLMSVVGKRKSFDQVNGGLRLDVTKSQTVQECFARITEH